MFKHRPESLSDTAITFAAVGLRAPLRFLVCRTREGGSGESFLYLAGLATDRLRVSRIRGERDDCASCGSWG